MRISINCPDSQHKTSRQTRHRHVWICSLFVVFHWLQKQPSRVQTLLLFYPFLIFCVPVSLLQGDRDTLFWGVKWSVLSRVGETWARLQFDDEKQKHTRRIPSPHSPGLLSSFPSVSEALWCRDAPHSPPATVWCVWSVCLGEEKEKWGHTNEEMNPTVLPPPTASLRTQQHP